MARIELLKDGLAVEGRKIVAELDVDEPDPELAEALSPIIDLALRRMEEAVEAQERRLEALRRLRALLRIAGLAP